MISNIHKTTQICVHSPHTKNIVKEKVYELALVLKWHKMWADMDNCNKLTKKSTFSLCHKVIFFEMVTFYVFSFL